MSMEFKMPIKLQNFLFLLGASGVVKLLFGLLGVIGRNLRGIDSVTYSRFEHYNIILVFIIVGVFNLCNNKVAQYIYKKSKEHFPRLRWYSMFFAWIMVLKIFLGLSGKLAPFDLFNAALVSCIIGALCYPNRTWKKRILSVFVFLGWLALFNWVTLTHAISNIFS